MKPHKHKCQKCGKTWVCKRKFANSQEEWICKMGRKSICDKCLAKM